MQVKITKIYRADKKKDGTPLIGQKGPYTKCSIKTEQHGDRWVGGFGNKTTDAWAEGQEVEINVVEKDGYLNFEVPNKDDKISRALEFLKDDVQAVKTECQMIRGQIADLVDYLKKNQIAFGSTKTGTYPQPTPAQHNAMAQNNHFAGGLGYNTDDRGAPLPEEPGDINPEYIPF